MTKPIQAIIFAAGTGKRMLPLTRKVCKPMLRIHNKPILEHILKSLPKEISEVIIIEGYFGNQIKKHFKNKYKHIKIKYITQAKPIGTWDALNLAKKYVEKSRKFLVLNADDLHSAESIKELIKYSNAILISKHREPKKFGVVEFDKNFILKNIQEKPKNPKSNFVSVGVYIFSPDIFNEQRPEPLNGEFFLPRVLNNYLLHTEVSVVFSKTWVSIGNSEEYLRAHELIT